MNRLRSRVLLVGIAAATVLGLDATAAQATFTARTAAPVTASATTLTVQPVTRLSTAGSVCTADGLEVHLSWTRSTTARVSSYRVKASTFFGYITVPIGSVAADRTTFVAQMGDNDLGYSFSVTTLTDYGWTAESAQTGTIRC